MPVEGFCRFVSRPKFIIAKPDTAHDDFPTGALFPPVAAPCSPLIPRDSPELNRRLCDEHETTRALPQVKLEGFCRASRHWHDSFFVALAYDSRRPLFQIDVFELQASDFRNAACS